MNKYKNEIQKGGFRSKLESVANELLKESGLSFDYESLSFILLDGFDFPSDSYEKIGKKFKNSKRVREVKYLADFIVYGKDINYLIETKGFLTPVARLKWKLLKQKVVRENLPLILFMPTNKTEILKTIEIIKNKESPNVQYIHKETERNNKKQSRSKSTLSSRKKE